MIRFQNFLIDVLQASNSEITIRVLEDGKATSIRTPAGLLAVATMGARRGRQTPRPAQSPFAGWILHAAGRSAEQNPMAK